MNEGLILFHGWEGSAHHGKKVKAATASSLWRGNLRIAGHLMAADWSRDLWAEARLGLYNSQGCAPVTHPDLTSMPSSPKAGDQVLTDKGLGGGCLTLEAERTSSQKGQSVCVSNSSLSSPLRGCPEQIGLWQCLRKMILIDDWYSSTHPTVGSSIPRQVGLTFIRKRSKPKSVSQRVSQWVAFPVVSTQVPGLTSLCEALGHRM